MFGRFGAWISGTIEKRVSAQTLRMLSSNNLQPFNLFTAQSKVRPETAIALTAVWHCINRISSDIAVLPLNVYKRRRTKIGGSDLAYDHYLTPLLQDSPDNGVRTSFNHRKLTTSHCLSWGNAYCELETTGGGKILACHVIHPSRVQVKVQDESHVYHIDGDKILPASKVLHYWGLSWDGITGLSPIHASSTAIAVGLSADAYSLAYFSNGAHTGGYIKYPGKYSPEFEKNYRESYDAAHMGVENAMRTGLLFGGAEYQAAGLSPLDGQLVEQRRYSISDIARIFGVPLSLLMEWQNNHYASYEESTLDYICGCIATWACCFEQQMTLRLLTQSERDAGYFIEHSLTRLLRGNSEARSKLYASGINNAWLSPNDVRLMENLPPIEGGDQYFIPKNVVPLSLAEQAALANTPAENPANTPAENPNNRLKGLLTGHSQNGHSND